MVTNNQRKPKSNKNWTEAELVLQFKLNRIVEYKTPLMQEWLEVENPVFDVVEQGIFDMVYQK